MDNSNTMLVMPSDTGICNGHIHIYNELFSPQGTNHSNHWCRICGLSFETAKVKSHDTQNNHSWIINYDGKTKDCLVCGIRNEPLERNEN